MQPMRAYIGIGSNLDDPVAQVRRAFQSLNALPTCASVACSPLYRTAPVGGPPGQPDYINAVAALDTALAPVLFIGAVQGLVIESALAGNEDAMMARAQQMFPLLVHGYRGPQEA